MSEESLRRLYADAAKASFGSVPPVEDQPVVVLCPWEVFELDGELHFVGYNWNWREGRVSTAITRLDLKAMRGTTQSGRVYELDGPPGKDRDSEWVLTWWLRRQGRELEDVRYVPLEELEAKTRGGE